jgi:hypothetical protein
MAIMCVHLFAGDSSSALRRESMNSLEDCIVVLVKIEVGCFWLIFFAFSKENDVVFGVRIEEDSVGHRGMKVLG